MQVGPVGMVARARARRGWLAIVLLGVLAGIVGGVVIAGVAGARRTYTAFDRLREAQHFPDLMVISSDASPKALGSMAALPEVEAASTAVIPTGRVLGKWDWYYPMAFTTPDVDVLRPIVIDGRLPAPDRPDEVLLSQQTANFSGYKVGDHVPFQAYTRDDFFVLLHGDSNHLPTGPALSLTITGIVKDYGDFIGTDQSKRVFGTPALASTFDAGAAQSVLLLRLKPGVDRRAFDAHVRAAMPVASSAESSLIFTDDAAGIAKDAARVLASGIVIFLVVAAVAGLFTVAQATTRSLGRAARDDEIRGALGMTVSQRRRALAAPLAGAVPVALVVAGAVAVALSPLFPIGSARSAEPSPGIDVNVAMIGFGLVAFAAVLGLMGAVLAHRQLRLRRVASSERGSTVGDLLSRFASRPTTSTGIRMAFDAGSGRRAVPVWSAITAVTIGVGGVIGVLAFDASLHRLVSSPPRYGQFYDLSVEFNQGDQDALVAALAKEPDFAGTALVDVEAGAAGEVGDGAAVLIDGKETTAQSIDVRSGSITPTLLSGRAPDGPDEVVVGPALLARLGKHVGDDVVVSAGAEAEGRVMRIVGTALSAMNQDDHFDRTMITTAEALKTVVPDAQPDIVVVKLAPHADRREAFARLDKIYPIGVQDESLPTPPASIDNLAGIGRLPGLLAIFLSLLALAGVVNALVVAIRRRRSDLAILRALGFMPNQSGATIVWMATATVVAGLVVGVPLGLVAAGVVWRFIAGQLHVQPQVVRPVLMVSATAVLALVLGVVAAAVPAWKVTRLRLAEQLHTE
jgi:putative ABC transport system permease protein